MIGMRSYERALERTFSEMIHCPKPMIHRINGDCRRRGQCLSSRGGHSPSCRAPPSFSRSGRWIGSVGGFGPDAVVAAGRRRQARAGNPDGAEAGHVRTGVAVGRGQRRRAILTNSMRPYRPMSTNWSNAASLMPALHQGCAERAEGTCVPRNDTGARMADLAFPVDGIARGFRRLLRQARDHFRAELEGHRHRPCHRGAIWRLQRQLQIVRRRLPAGGPQILRHVRR